MAYETLWNILNTQHKMYSECTTQRERTPDRKCNFLKKRIELVMLRGKMFTDPRRFRAARRWRGCTCARANLESVGFEHEHIVSVQTWILIYRYYSCALHAVDAASRHIQPHVNTSQSNYKCADLATLHLSTVWWEASGAVGRREDWYWYFW